MINYPFKIKIRIADSISDFYFTRKLRNSVSHLLTGNPNQITHFKQLLFCLYKPKNIKLFIVEIDRIRIGYLLFREENNTTFITEVISEGFRGRGIGMLMLEFAKQKYNHLTAHIIPSNIHSINLHNSNGFIKVFSQDKLVILEYKDVKK
jgi:hypothetical protein